jgi:hypothetical protein
VVASIPEYLVYSPGERSCLDSDRRRRVNGGAARSSARLTASFRSPNSAGDSASARWRFRLESPLPRGIPGLSRHSPKGRSAASGHHQRHPDRSFLPISMAAIPVIEQGRSVSTAGVTSHPAWAVASRQAFRAQRLQRPSAILPPISRPLPQAGVRSLSPGHSSRSLLEGTLSKAVSVCIDRGPNISEGAIPAAVLPPRVLVPTPRLLGANRHPGIFIT